MDVLSRPADEFDNDELIEQMWALKAVDHANVHFNLITSLDPRQLSLSPFDDIIYTTFRQDFPYLKVDNLTDDDLKSPLEKIKWRAFSSKFDKIEDFSMGTLLRPDSSKEFSPENSMFVIRIQFLAIEIARNREGFNDFVYKNCKPKNTQEEETTSV